MPADKSKIKVAHVVHVMSHGGIETFLMSMLRNYDRAKFTMDIVYAGPEEGKYAEEAMNLGAKMIPCRVGRDQVRFALRFLRILKNGNYDAVNSHISDMGAGAIWAAKLAGVPARVASYHENLCKQIPLKAMYRRLLRRIIVKNATAITTSSPDVSESHFTLVPASPGKVYPIAYGVDTEYFAQQPANRVDLKKFGFDDDVIIVGHVGRYVRSKNHQGLVRIAAKVIEHVPNVRFLLCGASNSGPLKKGIEQQIARLGLRNHFGMVEGFKDIREFYASIDIFVLPSLLEGMPVSLIEAQASGKPVVASNLGGIVRATAPQMHGNLFDPTDEESFAKCVIGLLRDKNKRISQGVAGQEFVKKHLDIKNAVRQYENLYLQLGQPKTMPMVK